MPPTRAPLLLGVVLLLAPALAAAQGSTLSLRFFGHGVGDIDRVKIPIDAPAVPADVGGDFTLEFWMKANAGENSATGCVAGNDGWITGNIIFDRDVFGPGDLGDYGLSLFQSGLAFGVAQGGSGGGLCGSVSPVDSQWHHVAVTRDATSGSLALWVDGVQDATAPGPSGDVSYQDGRSTSYPNSDPFLVIGAEKHDVASPFSGWVDEVRLSNVVRYTAPFTPATQVFSTDPSTVALYHFEEGPAGPCETGTVIMDDSGAAGGPSDGTCQFGGSGTPGPVYSTDVPPLAAENCGNGMLDPGEECDEPDAVDCDGCDTNCTFSACGNGVLCPLEEDCDDGNATPGDGCEPSCTLSPPALLSGKRILLRDRGGQQKLVVVSKDQAITAAAPGSAGDPTLHGATLRVGSSTDLATMALPAADWRGLGNPAGSRGYRYRGGSADPCRVVKVVGAKTIFRAVCKGALGFTLDEPSQESVAVDFEPGTGLASCLAFGGIVLKDQPETGRAGLFKAKNAPAPATCPLP